MIQGQDVYISIWEDWIDVMSDRGIDVPTKLIVRREDGTVTFHDPAPVVGERASACSRTSAWSGRRSTSMAEYAQLAAAAHASAVRRHR